MTCQEFVEFVMRYLDGDLDPEVRQAFDGHMGDCPSCITYLDTYRETVRLGKEVLCDDPQAPVPDEVPEELVQAILAARRS
ncbi:MAG: anti-sigma factor family protein [Myxococcota bacterium]